MYGVRVAPGVNATCHQHFFCMRLDPAIDDEQGGRCGGWGFVAVHVRHVGHKVCGTRICPACGWNVPLMASRGQVRRMGDTGGAREADGIGRVQGGVGLG